MKTLVLFVAGGLLLGAVSLGLGYWLTQEHALIQGGTAFALAFVPATLTLAWVIYSYRAVPEMQLLASLGGSGIRMAIALGGGFMLTRTRPQDFDATFWYWLLPFYLALLGFEMALVIWRQPTFDGVPQQKTTV